MSRDLQNNYNNNVVTKSNALIEANYKLTTTEQKIILFLVSKIRKEDHDFQTYTLPIKEFCELLGYQGTPKYSELRKITRDLIGKVLEIKEGKKLIQVSWLSYVEYSENEGSVVLSFDPRLKPYLLELKREFTSYKLKNVMELKSSYSIRLYEILKKWQNTKEVKIALAELRKMVGATDKYLEYHNFKKRVLKPAHKEITEKTDIIFNFKEIKKGKKVDAILFMIKNKSSEVLEQEPIQLGENNQQEFNLFRDDTNEHREILLSLGVSKTQIEKILDTYSSEQIQRNLEYVMKKRNDGEINKNIAGFCYSAIQGDWAVLNNKMESDLSQRSKKIIRKEMVPDYFENDGSIKAKREAYWKEYGTQDQYEQFILKVLELNQKIHSSEEQAMEKTLQALEGNVEKRIELGIELEKIEDFKNPKVREIYEMVIQKYLEPATVS